MLNLFFSTSEVYSPLIDTNTAKFPLNEEVNLIIKKTQARDSYYISKISWRKNRRTKWSEIS